MAGPVYYALETTSVAFGRTDAVYRRFKAFDALAAKLHWDRVAVGAPDLPQKLPAPGYNVSMLVERAAGLQLWANFIIAQPDALTHPDVCAFFGLPSRVDSDQVAQAERALIKMQAAGRGFLSRSNTPDVSSRFDLDAIADVPAKALPASRMARAPLVMVCLCILVAALVPGLATLSALRIHSTAIVAAPSSPPPPPPRKAAKHLQLVHFGRGQLGKARAWTSKRVDRLLKRK